MLIKISALMQEPIGESREYGFIGEIVADANINCEAELMRTDVGILVTATCASKQEHTCSLCLKPYTHKMQFSFEEEFYPVIDIATGRKIAGAQQRSKTCSLMRRITLISQTPFANTWSCTNRRILSANRIAPASAHSAEPTAIRYPASVRPCLLAVSGASYRSCGPLTQSSSAHNLH